MKKILLLILCLIMLTACADTANKPAETTPAPTPAESTATLPPETPAPTLIPFTPDFFPFTEANYPRVDGSTATIPLIGAVESVLFGKPRSEISVNVRKTSGAYRALANNEADLLLVYDGGDETRVEVNADALFETVPIGKDALVFIVSSDNPIDNLTSEQVRRIFLGEYTNWSEVGGGDVAVRAYQRGIGSGSQALMDKLVMNGVPMGNPATVPVVGDMGGLIDAVANYSGGPTAIGYNVYFYVTEMRGNDRIKILSIDGVAPSYDTIQSGAYPFVSEFYSVIRKSEPTDSPARALHDWMLTDEAQNLMASENYVALHANHDAATPLADGRFSLYPEGETPEYFEGSNLYMLEPSDKYGALYFYLGSVHFEEGISPEFYGLCTGDGKIVTEPVFTAPELLTDSAGNTAYLCYRSDVERRRETIAAADWSYERLSRPAIVFATNGSWVLEFDEVMQFYGFSAVMEVAMNADVLAVKLGGKWGAINIKGAVIIPFTRDSYDGIYHEPHANGDFSFLGVTGNRFMRSSDDELGWDGGFDLYDENLDIIATGLRGMPISRAATFILTHTWSEQSSISTYTLDGELLATTDGTDIVSGVPLGSNYVMLYGDDKDVICDKYLNFVCDFPTVYVEQNDWHYYTHMEIGPNVLYRSDEDSSLHRTYLPDGTRLVTWYDADMGDRYSADETW